MNPLIIFIEFLLSPGTKKPQQPLEYQVELVFPPLQLKRTQEFPPGIPNGLNKISQPIKSLHKHKLLGYTWTHSSYIELDHIGLTTIFKKGGKVSNTQYKVSIKECIAMQHVMK
jgi:hypothetical protein